MFNSALSSALSYITWGLIWDTKKKKERTIKILKEKEKSQGLEKLNLKGNTVVRHFPKQEKGEPPMKQKKC